MIEVCFCEKAHFYFTPPPSQSNFFIFWVGGGFSGKILVGLKQKHKKQPFSDASASHLSLVLWHV